MNNLYEIHEFIKDWPELFVLWQKTDMSNLSKTEAYGICEKMLMDAKKQYPNNNKRVIIVKNKHIYDVIVFNEYVEKDYKIEPFT